MKNRLKAKSLNQARIKALMISKQFINADNMTLRYVIKNLRKLIFARKIRKFTKIFKKGGNK